MLAPPIVPRTLPPPLFINHPPLLQPRSICTSSVPLLSLLYLSSCPTPPSHADARLCSRLSRTPTPLHLATLPSPTSFPPRQIGRAQTAGTVPITMEQTISSGSGNRSRRVCCLGYVSPTRLSSPRRFCRVFRASATQSRTSWSRSSSDARPQTLDALPAHLLTPFNGPVPPSNLLDKIAKGVTSRKSPVEWPHSLRATRAKIVELARLRAKEDTASDTIAEEETTDPEVLAQMTSKGSKRPLYRQSSMDFMQSTKLDPANDSIAR